MPLGPRCQRFTELRLTAGGRKVLGLEGEHNPARSESAEHWYWKMKVEEELRTMGYQVEVEKEGADLALEKNGKRIAVEIETGKSGVDANIKRNMAKGFDRILVIVTNKEPNLPHPTKHVRFLHASEVSRTLKDSAFPVTA